MAMRVFDGVAALSILAAFALSPASHGAGVREKAIIRSKLLQSEIENRLAIERLKRLGLEPDIELNQSFKGKKLEKLIQELLDQNAHINGEDERRNVGLVLPAVPLTGPPVIIGGITFNEDVKRNIRGVAAVMSLDSMEHVGNVWRPKTVHTFHDQQNVCIDKVNFALEPVLAECTAFLVDQAVDHSLVVTAGHCQENIQAKNLLFVFDFSGDDTVSKTEFPDTDVFCGKEVIQSSDEPSDWALIALDGKVMGRDPLPIDSNAVAVGDEVYMIGHSAGLPVKIGGGARILRIASESFVSDVDSMGGNSGSPIISVKSNKVVGILARSREGYVDIGGCRVIEACPSSKLSDCDGEGCTKITELPRLGPIAPATPLSP